MLRGMANRSESLLLQGLTTLVLLPWFVVALATKAPAFRKNPVLGSRLLNRLGLHVIRVVLAYGATHVRWFTLKHLVPESERRAFHRDGFLVIEDFLPQPMFDALAKDARQYQGRGLQQMQGDTLTQHVFLDTEGLLALPSAQAVIDHARFRDLLKYTGSHSAMPYLFLQRIVNGFADAGHDPQKDLHKDTFHPTMKAWLFLDDVDADSAPFTYVPGSHQLTMSRLRWEYSMSLDAARSSNGHTANGAFRLSREDLGAMGLPAPKAIAAKKNTLVLANTVGFHCRGKAKGRVTRLELWAYSRKNPFLLWPGFDSRTVQRIEGNIVRRVRNWGEMRTRKAGKQAQWVTTMLDFRR